MDCTCIDNSTYQINGQMPKQMWMPSKWSGGRKIIKTKNEREDLRYVCTDGGSKQLIVSQSGIVLQKRCQREKPERGLKPQKKKTAWWIKLMMSWAFPKQHKTETESTGPLYPTPNPTTTHPTQCQPVPPMLEMWPEGAFGRGLLEWKTLPHTILGRQGWEGQE